MGVGGMKQVRLISLLSTFLYFCIGYNKIYYFCNTLNLKTKEFFNQRKLISNSVLFLFITKHHC